MRPGAEERDDAALLRAVARGDEDALAALYDRHAGWLTVRMTRRCAMPDVVDHAVQDTFLALWREAGAYRGGGDVAAFIWGIGVRRLIDAIRRENRGRRRLPWRAAEPAVVVSAEDQVLAGIEHGRLGQALAGLSPELRGAIEATVLDGLTCAEAAVLLGVAEGTVKSRCHRARLALRAALADQQAGAETRPTADKSGEHHDEPISRRGRAVPEQPGTQPRTCWPAMPPGRSTRSPPGRSRPT